MQGEFLGLQTSGVHHIFTLINFYFTYRLFLIIFDIDKRNQSVYN
jgi:hypothetical protein